MGHAHQIGLIHGPAIEEEEMERKSKLGAMTAFLAAVAVTALLVTAISAVDADAGRGCHGKRCTTAPSAALTVSPNPVAAGDTFTVSGSGFTPDQMVVVTVTGDWGDIVTADGSGAFSHTRSLTIPWTYTFDASQEDSPGKWVVKASATLTVTAP